MEYEQLHEKAKEIAQALGWNYSPLAPYPGEGLPRWAVLVNPEGGEIHLSIVWNQKDRLHIGGRLPNGTNHWTKEKMNISVSKDKSPEAIAKDIARRLLPTYLPLYKETVEIERQANEREAADKAIATKLATILGETTKEKEIHFYRCNQNAGSGTIKVSSGEVSLDLRWVKPETAETICKVLVTPKPAPLPTCNNCRQTMHISHWTGEEFTCEPQE